MAKSQRYLEMVGDQRIRQSFIQERSPCTIMSRKWTLRQVSAISLPNTRADADIPGQMSQTEQSWFSREFTIPEDWDERVLLNFGAVDYHAVVRVNGKYVGNHFGGYAGFTIDITDALGPEKSDKDFKHHLLVEVNDPTDGPGSEIPIGKQAKNPSHIFYTPCSGIWQTVWIEAAPQTYIKSLEIHANDGNGMISAIVNIAGTGLEDWKAEVYHEGELKAMFTGKNASWGTIYYEGWVKWTPHNPALYNITIMAGTDTIYSYFAFRSLAIKKPNPDDTSQSYFKVPRPFLSGELYTQLGILDQGYWPDGIYTAPSYEAMTYDVDVIRYYGFNMIRKHVKVEPYLFYHYCDKVGMMVVQDIPNMRPTNLDHNKPSQHSTNVFNSEAREIVRQLKHFPSITTWTLYNEGWGQGPATDAPEKALAGDVRNIDPLRFIDAASGWYDHGEGNIHSTHNYPEPLCGVDRSGATYTPYHHDRLAAASEFGGLGTRPDNRNLWSVPAAVQGIQDTYRILPNVDEWNVEARKLWDIIFEQTRQDLDGNCSIAVWTQATDVEGEVNGLMTYDRRMVRAEVQPWRDILAKIYKEVGTRVPEFKDVPRPNAVVWNAALGEQVVKNAQPSSSKDGSTDE
jgi:hypothetical protein